MKKNATLKGIGARFFGYKLKTFAKITVTASLIGSFFVASPGIALATKDLTVTFAGTGGGSVAIVESPILNTDNSATLIATGAVTMNNNDAGTLTATADGNSFFTTWSGQSTGITGCSGDSCDYDMSPGGTPANQNVTVTFTLNTAPVALDGADSTDEDNATLITMLASDVDLQPLTYLIVSGPTNGSLDTMTPVANTVTYTPNADYNGSDSFTFKANDGMTDGNVATVTITVDAVNDAPSFTVGGNPTPYEDSGAQTVPGWATALSTGPANESGQVLTMTVTGNSNPTLFSVQPAVDPVSGDLTFTPAADASGLVFLAVTPSDDGGITNGGVDTGTQQGFFMDIFPVNDAPAGTDSTVAANEDSFYAFTSADFGFSDPVDLIYAPNQFAGVMITTLPAAGSLTLSGTPVSAGNTIAIADINLANLVFTPDAGTFGSSYATFTFQVQDDGGITNGGVDLDASANTMTIDVSHVNHAPVANPDVASAQEDDVAASTGSVLSNDTDQDIPAAPDILAVTEVNGGGGNVGIAVAGTYGSLTLNADGSFSYAVDNGSALVQALAAGQQVHDIFTYTITDNGTPSSATANSSLDVTITGVNDAPVAVADSYNVDEDQTLNPILGVLFNDSDVEGETMTAVLVDDVQNGSLTLNADGSFSYTPDTNYNGPDSFTYEANDGTVDGNTVTVSITVDPVNDDPVANADSYLADEDVAITFNAAAGVLANDTDVDTATTLVVKAVNGNTLAVGVPITLPSGATLQLNLDGSFTYTGPADYNGIDSFTYTAFDQTTGEAIGTVTVTIGPVNDAPSFLKGADETVLEDAGAQVVAGWATGMSAGPADESGQVLTFNVTGNTNGSLFAAGPSVDPSSGDLTYTPAANANGSATISLTLSDDGGILNGGVDTSASQSFDINVTSVNDDPVFTSTAPTSTVSKSPYAYNVTTSDPDPDTWTITAPTKPAWLTLTDNGDGTATLSGTPVKVDIGTHPVVLEVSDGSATTSQSFDVEVLPLFHDITATAGANGSITPSGAVSVEDETDQAFVIAPATGFYTASVLVDGVAAPGSAAGYTFTNVLTGHTIETTFAANGGGTSGGGTLTSGGGGGGGGGQVLGAFTGPNGTGNANAPGSGNGSGIGNSQGQVLGASSFVFNMNLRRGMRNNDVMELQKALKQLGFFNEEPTGYFGPITLASVKAYQKSKGLPETGFFGPLTRAALNAELAGTTTP